jgi:hypothetical protein
MSLVSTLDPEGQSQQKKRKEKKKKHLVLSTNDEKTWNPNCSGAQDWACRESKSSAREKKTSWDEERISAA